MVMYMQTLDAFVVAFVVCRATALVKDCVCAAKAAYASLLMQSTITFRKFAYQGPVWGLCCVRTPPSCSLASSPQHCILALIPWDSNYDGHLCACFVLLVVPSAMCWHVYLLYFETFFPACALGVYAGVFRPTGHR